MYREKSLRSRLDMRLHQLQKTADQLETAVVDQAATLAEQAREGPKQGRQTVTGWEKRAEKSLRANPMLYAGGAVTIIGLVLLLRRPWRK